MPRWRLYKNLLFGFLSENTYYDIFDKTTIFITYLLSFHKFILDFSTEKFSILELNPDINCQHFNKIESNDLWILSVIFLIIPNNFF